MITLPQHYDLIVLNEEFNSNRLKTELIDIEKFVKVNNCQEVSDPVFFNGPVPTSKGLLSNEIFGITKTERAGIYAYIDLGGWFLHPLAYRVLYNLNSKIKEIVHGTDYFRIDEDGKLVKDPDGSTGIEWLKENLDKINFNTSDTKSRQKRIKFINKFKDRIWIKKYIVIPAYYRDVDTKQASIGVGEINKLYSSLLLACKSLRETSTYGLSLSNATKGRIQQILTSIYEWFGKGTTLNGQQTAENLPGKTGLIKRGVMYKTVDYSTRLVMSCPELKAETLKDIMVDMDHAALPLASALANFKPFIIFWMRRYFENLYAGKTEIVFKSTDNDRIRITVPLLDYQTIFSDERINEEIERYIHGYSNRFIKVPVPIDKAEFVRLLKEKKIPIKNYESDKLFFSRFTGRKIQNDYKSKHDRNINYASYPLSSRPLTWCDLFFMAACDVTEDKMVLITRFPIDSYLNQYPSKVRIKSTNKTVPVYVNNKFYRWYPDIKEEDIGKNTSSLFSDTLSISNGRINAMIMDYDGDTAIVKPIYTVEANKECEDAMNSKLQIIGMNGISERDISKEAIVTLYALTIHPDDSIKFTDPIF